MERSLESLLAWWDVSGVDVPDIPQNSPRRLPTRASQDRGKDQGENPRNKRGREKEDSKPVSRPAASPEPMIAATDLVKKVKTLEQLRLAIADFDAGEISDHARQSVFARGNPEADIMVIGEAPGRDEDIQGKPFVGQSGQFLDRIFASIGLNEDTLYMTNVINWRPPGNRNPKLDEIAACLPIIHKHIELIEPKIIVLVGGVSYSALTGTSGIMKNRGQWTNLSIGGTNIPALPIYHPAFLLRQPALKKDTWLDMLSLRARQAELGISLPAP